MIIEHACVNWENYIPKNVKTLILGSFNPNNVGNNANYYYGRSSNYLWKTIGEILFANQMYYFNGNQLNNQLAYQTMEKYQFCFYDLIENLTITGNNAQHEVNFVNSKILSGFSDSVLFTNNTNFDGFMVNIQRTFNNEILDFLNNKKPERIIHTLGNGTVNLNFNSFRPDLNEFLVGISNVCLETITILIPISISPSQININRHNQFENLTNWLTENLNL